MTRPKPRCTGLDQTLFRRCGRPATVERDGRLYCYQHDPERRRRILKEKTAAARRRQLALEREWDRRDERMRLLEAAGLVLPDDETLKAVVALGGIKAMIERLKGG